MLASLAIASGLFTTLFMGARVETRVREFEGATPGSTEFAVDVEVLPYARFEAKTRHFDFKLDYAADVTQPDLEGGFPVGPQLYQLADLSAWYSHKDWLVGVSQGGGFGTMNFSYLTPYLATAGPSSGPPPVQLVPCADAAHCANQTVELGSSATSVWLHYTHDRTSLSIAPSYTVSGGLDEASRRVFPVLSMPRVDASLEYTAGRRDSLATRVSATAADSTPRGCNPATGGPPVNRFDLNPPTCAPRSQWGTATEVWSHRITRRTTLELTGGAAVVRSEIDPSQSYGVLPYPVTGIQLDYGLKDSGPDRPAMHPVMTDPTKPGAYIYAREGPVVDTFWGIVDPRFEVGAAIFDPLDADYSLLGRAAFVRSMPPTVLDATYFAADAEILRHLDKYRFDVGGGLRGAVQDDPFTGRFYVISAYLTFIWHEPRIKL